MARIRQYTPNPVFLPLSARIRRELRVKRPRFGDMPFSAAELRQYDETTLLYDIFLNAGNDRLFAVGPPLLNLRPICTPLRLCVRDGRDQWSSPLSYKEAECDKTTAIYEFDLPKGRLDPPLSVALEMGGNLRQQVVIPRSSSAGCRLAMVAIQKNNRHHWISDWARYHHDLGVERLVLYDNASEDADGLRATLAALPDGLDVVLVDWPFKYGPARGWGNRYAQRGMLNHVARKWDDANWVLNVDIDEYVVPGRGVDNLREWLDTRKPRDAILRFRRYNCPILERYRIDDLSQVSVRDFPIRMKQARDRSPKYAFRPAKVSCLTPHWGKTVRRGRSVDLEADVLCAFHYLGIATGWKDEMHRIAGRVERSNRREQYSETEHVEDLAVIDRMSRIDPTGT